MYVRIATVTVLACNDEDKQQLIKKLEKLKTRKNEVLEYKKGNKHIIVEVSYINYQNND